MDKLRSCRSCLVIDAKLNSVNVHPRLKEAYEMVMGSMNMNWDNMPQHICNFCSAILLKFLMFKNKCNKAQNFLDEAVRKNGRVTNHYICGVNRLSHGLSFHFTIENEQISIIPSNNEELLSDENDYKTIKEEDTLVFHGAPIDKDVLTTNNPNYIKELQSEPPDFRLLFDINIETVNLLKSGINEVKSEICNKSLEMQNKTVNLTESSLGNDIDLDSDNNIDQTLPENLEICEAIKLKELDINDKTNDIKTRKSKINTKTKKRAIVCKPSTTQSFTMKINKCPKKTKCKETVNKAHIKEKKELERNKADEILYNYTRITLTKEQQLKRVEARKNSLSYLQARFKCEKCYRGFNTEQVLKSHEVIHDPNRGPQICEICGIRYRFPAKLQNHIDSVHRYNYVCNLCDFRALSRCHALTHHGWHQGVRYPCKYCNNVYEKISTWLTHMRLAHPAENISCELCGESFIGPMGLRMHKRRAHRDKCEVLPKPYCNSCGRQFYSYVALQRHSELKPDGSCRSTDLSPCVHCGEYLDSKESLAQHVYQQHNGDNKSDIPSFECPECPQRFISEGSRDVHLKRVHMPQKKITDNIRKERCNQTDVNVEILNFDVICEHCGKTIKRYNWATHQRIHTGERPYHCAHCPNTFRTKTTLQAHMIIHSDKKPFKCGSCGKAFSRYNVLKVHQVVHTGERNFKCQICGNTFTQSSSLHNHIKWVHMNIPPPPRARHKKKQQPDTATEKC